VGALTSRPYSFTQRPWELYSNLVNPLSKNMTVFRVDFDGGKVKRVLPTRFKNLPWLSDSLRLFVYAVTTNVLVRKLFSCRIYIGVLSVFSNIVFPSFLYTIKIIYNVFSLSYIYPDLRFFLFKQFDDVFFVPLPIKYFFISERSVACVLFPSFSLYNFNIFFYYIVCRIL
jgi:hypothetical protein